jgi:hypothetical protein
MTLTQLTQALADSAGAVPVVASCIGCGVMIREVPAEGGAGPVWVTIGAVPRPHCLGPDGPLDGLHHPRAAEGASLPANLAGPRRGLDLAEGAEVLTVAGVPAPDRIPG